LLWFALLALSAIEFTPYRKRGAVCVCQIVVRTKDDWHLHTFSKLTQQHSHRLLVNIFESVVMLLLWVEAKKNCAHGHHLTTLSILIIGFQDIECSSINLLVFCFHFRVEWTPYNTLKIKGFLFYVNLLEFAS